MDQDRTGRQASEDTSRAEEHVRNAEENRDALEAQHSRVESTTPSDVDMP
jgi:cell division septum initiation protein DivIVA